MTASLREMGRAVAAFSGGVDSSLLIRAAAEAMGPGLLAVTASSATYPERELEAASACAASLGVRHIVLATDELHGDEYARNDPDRCYYCKTELFGKLRAIAAREGITHILDGSNRDDRNDYRPGTRAAREFGVRSPLAEAGLSKADVRELAKKFGLLSWNKPSLACLSSRIPYGTRITAELLGTIDRAEQALRGLGFEQLRVRHHGDTARIEVLSADVARLLDREVAGRVVTSLKALGYAYVCLDLEGYRTGSMNEILAHRGAAHDEARSGNGKGDNR